MAKNGIVDPYVPPIIGRILHGGYAKSSPYNVKDFAQNSSLAIALIVDDVDGVGESHISAKANKS